MSISLGIYLVFNIVYVTTSLYDLGKCKCLFRHFLGMNRYFLTCSMGAIFCTLVESIKVGKICSAPSSVLSFVKVTALITVTDESDSFLLSTVK